MHNYSLLHIAGMPHQELHQCAAVDLKQPVDGQELARQRDELLAEHAEETPLLHTAGMPHQELHPHQCAAVEGDQPVDSQELARQREELLTEQGAF